MYQVTQRTKVRRLPERASYDPAVVHAILDEGFVCHVGFVVDGQPYVVPTGYARRRDHLPARLHRQQARPAAGHAGVRHRDPAGRAGAGQVRVPPF